MKCKMIELYRHDKLIFVTIVTATIWMLIQIGLMVAAWDRPLEPDEEEYTRNAMRVLASGNLYPSDENMYDMIIHSPGVTNYLALIHFIFGSFRVEWIVNLLMNAIILYEVFYIAKSFFGQRVGCIAVILYCIIINTWFVPLKFLSEQPSYFLFITGFCLGMQKKWYWVVLGGICYALSYTIRPTALAYVVTSVLFLIVCHRNWKYYLYLLVPYVGLLYGIGKYYENTMGVYVNSTYASGFCLCHAANNETWSGPNMSFAWTPGNTGYIENPENLTFVEKDSIWKSRAVEWIKENPVRYALLVPQRVFRNYALDDWATNDVFVKDPYGRALRSSDPERAMLIHRISQFAVSVPYYIVLLMFVMSIFVCRKDIFSKKGIILLITLLYTGSSFLTVAEHRSHYAFFFPLIIWAAYGLTKIKGVGVISRKNNSK